MKFARLDKQRDVPICKVEGMQVRAAITHLLLLLVSSSVIAQAIPDSPENRQHQAERYLATMSPRDLVREAVERAASSLPPEQKDEFKENIAAHFDFESLSNAMKAAMVEHFSADELKALADLYSSSVGKSAKSKFGAYMADVATALQAEISKARARVDDRAKPR